MWPPKRNHSDYSGLCTGRREAARRAEPPAISYICSRCMPVSVYLCLVQSSRVGPSPRFWSEPSINNSHTKGSTCLNFRAHA